MAEQAQAQAEQKDLANRDRLRIEIAMSNSGDGTNLDVQLDLPATGVTAIWGASGAGKTSLLRGIAGLEHLPGASIQVGGQIWQSADRLVPTHQRELGYVFQEASLFSHLSVADNLAFARSRAKRPLAKALVEQAMSIFGIQPLLNRSVETLSGGERQRVAIMRALLSNPRLLLMDEPLASLDSARKKQILNFLVKLFSQFNLPVIYVSHDVHEVARIADHLVIIESGRAIAQGGLAEMLNHPLITGEAGYQPFSLITGEVSPSEPIEGLSAVKVGAEKFLLPKVKYTPGGIIRLQIDASNVSLALTRASQTSILNIIECHIESICQTDEIQQSLVTCQIQGQQLRSLISSHSCKQLGLAIGQKVYAQIKAVSLLD